MHYLEHSHHAAHTRVYEIERAKLKVFEPLEFDKIYMVLQSTRAQEIKKCPAFIERYRHSDGGDETSSIILIHTAPARFEVAECFIKRVFQEYLVPEVVVYAQKSVLNLIELWGYMRLADDTLLLALISPVYIHLEALHKALFSSGLEVQQVSSACVCPSHPSVLSALSAGLGPGSVNGRSPAQQKAEYFSHLLQTQVARTQRALLNSSIQRSAGHTAVVPCKI